ncbi:MAG: ribonuclease HII [Candidatus Diapherotrites archaeon]
MIAGIDEAGRGPVIGPMVLAIAVIEKKDEDKLLEIGVKDSKLLTPIEREKIYSILEKNLLEYNFIIVSPNEIDEFVEKNKLNELEALKAAKLISQLSKNPSIVYVDSPDVVMDNFAKRIKKYLPFNIKIVSEHKADKNYPIVSAASIIAKVKRDLEIKKISEKFGDLGSGYSHDEITIKFLNDYLLKNNHFPDFVRKSWQTSKFLQENKFQKKIWDGYVSLDKKK